jgi:large subunit ribosomal protein L18
VKKVANGRPRLSVHRSSKNIYAQVIDDRQGRTLPLPRRSKKTAQA